LSWLKKKNSFGMVFVGGKKWDDNVSGFTFWYDF